jgi:hypothetical protein
MKALLLLSIAIILAGCSHTKYIKNHKDEVCDTYCPDKVIERIVQTVRIDTLWETALVEVELPKDTVVIYRYIKIVDGKVNLDTIYVTNGLAKAKAWVKNSELGLMVYNTDTYKAKIDSLQKLVITYDKESTTDRTIKIVETKNPWWLWYLILIAFGLGVFGKKLIKLTSKLWV